jgi:tetratricopeptide (TPR) repeat protein
MKKLSLLLIFCFVITGLAAAQDYKGKGRVKGIVTDEQGNPLEGVRIKLFSVRANQGFNVETDATGEWKGSWIRSGEWNVDFEKPGYAPKKISMDISEFKRNPDIEVSLTKIEGLAVSAELEAQLAEGNKLFDAEAYDEARAVFEAILTENPDAYIVNQNIGNCFFQQEKYTEAILYYEKILEHNAESSSAIINIGNCYANMSDNEKALEWYKKLSFEKIDDVIVLFNIGTNYYNMAQYEEALKYYERSVEIQPDYLDGLYQLGLVYLSTEKKESSIAAFEKYLEFDSETGRADQVRGFLDYLKK